MSWLAIDDKIPRHPKVARLSDAAFRLHVAALCHCAEYETDGVLDESCVDTLTTHKNKATLIKELEGAKGVRPDGNPLWKRIVGGWTIHGFLDWNPSHAEQEARRAEKEAAKKAARDRMSRHRSNAVRLNIQRTDSEHSANVHPGDAEFSSEPSRARTRAGGMGIRSGDLRSGQNDGTGCDSDLEGVEGEALPNEPPEAARAALTDAPAPRPESGYDLARRVFAEEWAARYGEPYVFSTDLGPRGEDQKFRTVGEHAKASGGARAEEFLRHWARRFVRDDRDFYARDRHPGRLFTIDAVRGYGQPTKPRPHAPAKPREPEPPPLPPAESAARGREAIARLVAGIGLGGIPTGQIAQAKGHDGE